MTPLQGASVVFSVDHNRNERYCSTDVCLEMAAETFWEDREVRFDISVAYVAKCCVVKHVHIRCQPKSSPLASLLGC